MPFVTYFKNTNETCKQEKLIGSKCYSKTSFHCIKIIELFTSGHSLMML